METLTPPSALVRCKGGERKKMLGDGSSSSTKHPKGMRQKGAWKRPGASDFKFTTHRHPP